MLKKTVTYTDFDGNQRTEDLYFNMTKSELVEFSFGMPEEMSNTVKSPDDINDETANKLIEKIGNSGIFNFVKDLVFKSYGVKSEDGRRFIKNEQTTIEFTQTLAYDEFLMNLFSDDRNASDFINGIIPAEMAKQIPAVAMKN